MPYKRKVSEKAQADIDTIRDKTEVMRKLHKTYFVLLARTYKRALLAFEEQEFSREEAMEILIHQGLAKHLSL